MLIINKLSVFIEDKSVLTHVNLTCNPGTTHVVMGPNGSGKSSLAYTLMGHPRYTVMTGEVTVAGSSIISLSPDKRAQLGLFLAYQHPYEIPGLSIMTFLKDAYQACKGGTIDVPAFVQHVNACLEILGFDAELIKRNVNEGFSGGEKKRFELLQMLVLEPSLIILDEIDSGLDIDALKTVSKALAELRRKNPALIVIVITHYRRLLDYLPVDHVHLLYKGTIVASGDRDMAIAVEHKGYDGYRAS